jgi:hypothetical protein
MNGIIYNEFLNSNRDHHRQRNELMEDLWKNWSGNVHIS